MINGISYIIHNMSAHYLSDSFVKYDDNNNAKDQVDNDVEVKKDGNDSCSRGIDEDDSNSSGSGTSRKDNMDSSSEGKEEFSDYHSNSE